MTTEAKTSVVDRETNFDDLPPRNGLLDYIPGLPEGHSPPAPEPETEKVLFPFVEDRPEHAHMFPPYGTHVPNVPRYPSGHRSWHDVKLKSDSK